MNPLPGVVKKWHWSFSHLFLQILHFEKNCTFFTKSGLCNLITLLGHPQCLSCYARPALLSKLEAGNGSLESVITLVKTDGKNCFMVTNSHQNPLT